VFPIVPSFLAKIRKAGGVVKVAKRLVKAKGAKEVAAILATYGCPAPRR
jgi:hypothetical protein